MTDISKFTGDANFMRIVMDLIKGMDPEEREKFIRENLLEAQTRLWTPYPGMQFAAYHSPADELLVMGIASPGKSSLLIGIALTQSPTSVIFRKEFPQIRSLIGEVAHFLGGDMSGYNSTNHTWKLPNGRMLEFASMPHGLQDATRQQGRARHSFLWDELSFFSREQYTYALFWNRPPNPESKARCRSVAVCNPPMPGQPGFNWIPEHWAPWIDPAAPLQLAPGELAYALPIEPGSDRDIFFVDAGECREYIAKHYPKPELDRVTGEIVLPRTRSFYPAVFQENVAMADTGYNRTLLYAGGAAFQGIATGDAQAGRVDAVDQVFPTSAVDAAMDRWTEEPPKGVPMSALAVDIALGGGDETVIALRHGGWFGKLIAEDGKGTPIPDEIVRMILLARRNDCAVVIDAGGGFGSGVEAILRRDYHIEAVKFVAAGAANFRSKCKTWGFVNMRAAATWMLRQALLEPDCKIAFPRDPRLKAELLAQRWFETSGGDIQILSKDELRKPERLGRSPDRADAVIYAWWPAQRALQRRLSGPDSGARHSTHVLQTRAIGSEGRDRYSRFRGRRGGRGGGGSGGEQNGFGRGWKSEPGV